VRLSQPRLPIMSMYPTLHMLIVQHVQYAEAYAGSGLLLLGTCFEIAGSTPCSYNYPCHGAC
jgi:hypothetical protein